MRFIWKQVPLGACVLGVKMHEAGLCKGLYERTARPTDHRQDATN